MSVGWVEEEGFRENREFREIREYSEIREFFLNVLNLPNILKDSKKDLMQCSVTLFIN